MFNHLRNHALSFFKAGIDAANPYDAVKRYIQLNNNIIQLGNSDNKCLINFSKLQVIAFGKAACAMAKAVQDIIPAQLLQGNIIAVTNYENVSLLNNIEVIGASHPLPDNNGFKAAQKIAEKVKYLSSNDLVLVLISGGGSALIPYPVEPITLEEKIMTTQLLLSSGASINEINCVRKHLSHLKGGGLMQLAYPAQLHALVLSDVLDNDISAIASGTTVFDNSTYQDAISILNTKNLWTDIPHSVKNHLQKGAEGFIAETPKYDNVIFKNSGYHLIGSNSMSVNAMQNAVQMAGFNTEIISYNLCGEAKIVAEKLVSIAKTHFIHLNKPLALLAGGETTVTLKGNGKGGRNQEMVLAFILAAQKQNLTGNWVFLSGGTDGIDGVTNAAGGIVDNNSLARIHNAQVLLENNDSYHALKQANDLLIIGATGTNVADLQILLLMPH